MTKLNVKGSRKKFILSVQTTLKKIARATPGYGDLFKVKKGIIIITFDAIVEYDAAKVVNAWKYLDLDVGDMIMVIGAPVQHANYNVNRMWLIEILDIRRQRKSHLFISDLKQRIGQGDLTVVSRFSNTEP